MLAESEILEATCSVHICMLLMMSGIMLQVTSPDQVDLASEHQSSAPEQQQKQKSRPLLLNGAEGARQEQQHQQPSALNKTAYAFHTCHVPGLASFRLAASYFPGAAHAFFASTA